MTNRKVNIGIGFATGRKSFKKVLQTYVYNWRECGLLENSQLHFNLFVAYDLNYSNTVPCDYTSLSSEITEWFQQTYFIGTKQMKQIRDELTTTGILNRNTSRILFESGYSAKRNAILYSALKNGMDYLLFLDDDEYPLAVANARSSSVWGGQNVLLSHLKYIPDADLTNGYHCGYISPVPFIQFNSRLTEKDFRLFIEAISNDVLNWDSMREVIRNGGITYADEKILFGKQASEVPETKRCKFITGSNLCINLTRPERVFPFYNPPGARGEDTFLSTRLSNRKVLRIPCYTFHDGFGAYAHLMDGVLPTSLKYIKAGTSKVTERFYNACIGWMRYKPLYLYLTDPDNYTDRIREIREKLTLTLPKVCDYFDNLRFMNLLPELEHYNRHVMNHNKQFTEAQQAWARITQKFSPPMLTPTALLKQPSKSIPQFASL